VGDLAELEARVRSDLARLAYPAPGWMPTGKPAAMDMGGDLGGDGGGNRDDPVLDVAIIGGGQGGLATAFGLLRERITNIAVFDRNRPGEEGPWVTFARMLTLRTPKHVTGPDLGIPSLTPQSWFEARHGREAWEALGKISRHDWQDYLAWYRRVLRLPVENETELVSLRPEGALLRLELRGPDGAHRGRLARKLVLATGIDGGGAWHIPELISAAVPAGRYAHTSQGIDFGQLRGRRVGVLGAGASAFDNAATALEAGAASVALCLRRAEIPRINPYRWMESAGFLGHFAELPDLMRWRFMRHIYDLNQPPPQDTFWRCRRHEGFSFHTGCPWEAVRMEDDAIVVRTPKGTMRFDFVIIGTGFTIDLGLRPELAGLAPHVALWRDRFTPPPGEESTPLASHPYLGDAFQFLERRPGEQPWLGRIHNFTFGATPSMGLSGASISGMKFGVSRLVRGIARDFYREDAGLHLQSLLSYTAPELVSLDAPSA